VRVVAAALVAGALALVSAAGCRSPNVAGQCEPTPKCLTGVECDYDKARGCNVCRCKPPMGTTPQTVPGTPPIPP
jgi:hypothetical protein